MGVTSKKLGTAIIRINTDRSWDTSDTAPHYRGSLKIHGIEFGIALWVENRAGELPLKLAGQVTTVPARKP